jgi:hypothetical protein
MKNKGVSHETFISYYLLISTASLFGQIGGLIRDVTDTAADVVEGAGEVAAAPFEAAEEGVYYGEPYPYEYYEPEVVIED